MNENILGRTGLAVSVLGFGSMELRGPKTWDGRPVTDEQADRLLNAVLDAGINFIDTAPDYGLAEERIGQFISSRRKKFFLATKCGCNPREVNGQLETPHLWTRENLRRNIEESLRRMKTDHVDVLQLHNPTPEEVERGDLLAELEAIRKEGLTRHFGISTTLPHLPEFADLGVFETFQIPYSCLQPQHRLEIALAAGTDAGTIIRGGIANGGPESSEAYDQTKQVWKNAHLDDLLEEGQMPAELILRYTLSHPDVDTVIVGTLDEKHLADNVQAAEFGPLPAEVYDQVTERVNAVLKIEDETQ